MTSSPAPNDGRLTFTPASTPQPTLLWPRRRAITQDTAATIVVIAVIR